MHDVTPLLRVDPDVDHPDSPERALALIRQGDYATVADDTTARVVLVTLGLTKAQADDQIRVSHGPLA